MIPPRVKRRLLLGLLSRQTPDKLLNRARSELPSVVASAGKRSPAYAQLLDESGVESLTTSAAPSFDDLPVLDKSSTFERFELNELLARDVPVSSLSSVLTSSGYGAVSFGFGLSDRNQQAVTPDAIDLGLQNAFAVDQRRTLIINTLPMGVVFESHATCVSNVSVREDMAFAILRQAGPLFEQVILVVDPLFAKRFFDYADERGYDFSAQRIHMIIGEETFQEPYRDYLMTQLGLNSDGRDTDVFLGSSMGVGELGLNLFFETPETVALRRALYARDPLRRQPMIFCFNPLRSWIEIHNASADGRGDLLVTMMDKKVAVPLPRYRTGDRASWVTNEFLADAPAEVQRAFRGLPFPAIALHGRERDQLNEVWHVDDLKALQYRDPTIARQLSGAFRCQLDNACLHWHLQLASDAQFSPSEVKAHLACLARDGVGASPEHGDTELAIEVFPYAEFPYGMRLDYERKFRYQGAILGAGSHGG